MCNSTVLSNTQFTSIKSKYSKFHKCTSISYRSWGTETEQMLTMQRVKHATISYINSLCTTAYKIERGSHNVIDPTSVFIRNGFTQGFQSGDFYITTITRPQQVLRGPFRVYRIDERSRMLKSKYIQDLLIFRKYKFLTKGIQKFSWICCPFGRLDSFMGNLPYLDLAFSLFLS